MSQKKDRIRFNHHSLFSKRWIQAFYYKLHTMSFKHYSYLYLNRSKHGNSFYKFYQTDRRGSSIFIPLDYEWILLNFLKSNHIFILCHMLLLVILLSWDCHLLTDNPVTRNVPVYHRTFFWMNAISMYLRHFQFWYRKKWGCNSYLQNSASLFTDMHTNAYSACICTS